jgi:hypothetical protein
VVNSELETAFRFASEPRIILVPCQKTGDRARASDEPPRASGASTWELSSDFFVDAEVPLDVGDADFKPEAHECLHQLGNLIDPAQHLHIDPEGLCQ